MKWDPIKTPGYEGIEGGLGIAVKQFGSTLEERENARNKKVPQHVTHIAKVEIKVQGDTDPNRIAKRTADVLTDLHRHPKVASMTGNPTFLR